MPHGHCYLWEPALVWIQLLSNLAIGLAYVAIAITLVYMVRRIEDLPFKLVYVCFAVFIVTCGFTHFMDAYVIWNPAYWLDGGIRIVTAIASVGTAVLLPPLIPDVVALARGARAAHRRGVKLESMVDDLETMYEQTKELEQLKTDFFANVSHELRTPLQLILGPAEKLAASESLDDRDRERVDMIVRNSRVLLKHVNDLLDVASMEAGKLEVAYDEIDVGSYVRRLAANFETIADEQDIALVLEVPDELRAEVDPDKFESIVLNLLSNAFKFAPGGGTVRCTVSATKTVSDTKRVRGEDGEPGQSRMMLVVADSGPGVPVEDREAIFERFRQLDSGATRRTGGTGLGLVITRDFIEMHHGAISVGEAPEGGALFTVELPLEAPEGAYFQDSGAKTGSDGEAGELVSSSTAAERSTERRQRTAAAEPAGEAIAEESKADRPLVLVVEDNPDMNEFVVESLADRYHTESAFDGEQGLEMALRLEPDLIVSDIMMPEMSGDQLVRKVRANPQLDSTSILLLTAKADDALRIELLREGAQDYVMKPFEVEELRARVDNHVAIARTRKLLQAELKSSRRDLESLAADLATSRTELERSLETARVALAQAEQASKAKSSFLGLVSHELRTPVAALQLQVAVLQEDDELSSSSKKMVERMSASLARLTQLIESLLHRAQLESGRIVVEEERVEPASLTAEIVDEMRGDARQAGLELRFEPADDLDGLVTDPRLLRLVLANLVRNALRYTDEGHVTVGVVQQDQSHRFSVADTGPGIAPEHRVRLFEPFERGEDASARQLPGAGLGLALVRDLVEALGGNIELESEVGGGSTFTVVVPSGGTSEFSGEMSHE